MKNIAHQFIIVLLLLFVTGSSKQIVPQQAEECKRERLRTAEPGTCLHPDAYRVLKAIEKIEGNPFENKRNRRVINLVEPRVYKVIDTIVRSDSLIVPLRIYYPDKKSTSEVYPIIFYIHGGAFMYGNIEQYDMLAKKICRTTKAIVSSVEYRLAPAHPYPAAINDSYCALNWVAENAERIGGHEEGVYVMGSSAGGNIATVLTLKSRDFKGPKIAGQILFYPPTTFLETEFPSRLNFFRDSLRSYMLTEELCRKCKKNYLGTYTNYSDPYISPAEAALSSDLPSALIFTAQCDPLRDDGRIYAELLMAAGVDVSYIESKGMIHGYLSFYLILKEARRSLLKCREYIHTHSELSPSLPSYP